MSSMGDSDTDGDRPLLHNGLSLFWPIYTLFSQFQTPVDVHTNM